MVLANCMALEALPAYAYRFSPRTYTLLPNASPGSYSNRYRASIVARTMTTPRNSSRTTGSASPVP